MAEINIIIKDNEDGTFDVEVTGDTKLSQNMTDAQNFAVMVVCMAKASKMSIQNASIDDVRDVFDSSQD